jgi:hypothetical protein
MSTEQEQQYESQDDSSLIQGEEENFAMADGGFVLQDKKGTNRNSLLLGGALLVTCLFAGSFYLRGGPQEAEAAGGYSQASETVTSFLSSGDGGIGKMKQMLHDTERVVEQFLTYPTVTQVPLDELAANPFRFRASSPQSAQVTQDDEARRREEQRLAVLQAVQKLQLQSIMHSDARRACMINNVVYLEGQQVEGFVVRTINPASVIVQQDRYRFELKMLR